MAGRHFFPLLNEADIGPDTAKVLPMFPSLTPVRYRAGMPAEQLVTQLRGKTRVALDAPPAARKSVDMPASLVRGGFGRAVVHCMPSRLLSVSLHDYVSTIHSDVQCTVVTDYEGPDTFPTEGLIFVSSGILLAYMSAWRAHGTKMDVVLFLDEMHESDFATASLRRLQNAAPGVKVYIEATATRGAGMGGNFPKPVLPGTVNNYDFQRVSAAKWDMMKQGSPWSLLKTSGDFLVFEDDPTEARLMCEKFRSYGVRAYRLTAKTGVDDFRRTMDEINNPQPDVGVAALVVDYSFRSGFTFKTVSRIIDPGEVRYLVVEHGRPVWYKRAAYIAELYQARNRGGRIEGQVCDYWCGEPTAEPVSVLLEGVEADIACIAQRMLGFRPETMLEKSLYFAGKVPRQFEHILCGEQPLRVYASSSVWPGEDHAPPAPEPLTPMEADFPMTPESMGCDEDRRSVFTMDDEEQVSVGSITQERFEAARSRASHVRSRAKPRLEDPPPMPALDGMTADNFNDAFSKLAKDKPGVGCPRASLEFGAYYYAAHLDVNLCTHYNSFSEVLADAHSDEPALFLRGLPTPLRREIAAYALLAYNDSVVVATAANFVMKYVSESETVEASVDPHELTQWATDVRGQFLRANGRARVAMDYLLVLKEHKYLKLSRLSDRESKAAEEFLNMLSVHMRDDSVEQDYRDTMPGIEFNPSGRYYLDVQPGGWREKLALACLGRKPGVVDLMVRPIEQGGSTSAAVHTTASELALAANRV